MIRAFRCYYEAGLKGHADAQLHVGMCFEKGQGLDFQSSPEAGSRGAAKTGTSTKSSSSSKSSSSKSKKKTSSMASSELSSELPSELDLPRFDFKRDMEQAFSWYLKAAEGGNVQAQSNVSVMFRTGANGACPQDMRKSFYWCERAAEGKPRAPARMRSDAVLAREKMIAAEANYNLGIFYMTGQSGEAPDEAKALSAWVKGALNGSVKAMFNLGQCYCRGGVKGIKPDPDKAEKWLTKAAEGGLCEAQFALGELLRAKHDRIATGRSSSSSMVENVPCNEDSLSILERSGFWFRKASAQGHPGAAHHLEEIGRVS